MKLKLYGLACAALLCATASHAADSQRIAIDGGVSIELPGDWKTRSMPNMAMRLPGMREVLNGASEIRIDSSDTGIMVSYMYFKPAEDTPAPVIDDASIAAQEATVRTVARQYLPNAQETAVVPRTVRLGDLVVSLATLSAKNGKAFPVGSGYVGGCVTTGSIRRGTEAWVISVVSSNCRSESHSAAVEALFSAQSGQR